MTLYVRIAILVVAILFIGGVLVGIHRWDQNRLKARYDAGRADERAVWIAARNTANVEQAKANSSATKASETAADAARAGAQSDLAHNATVAQQATQELTRAHVEAKTPVCQRDAAGRAAVLPAGVLDALDKARESAVGG